MYKKGGEWVNSCKPGRASTCGARISRCSLPDPAACGAASACPPIWQTLNVRMPIDVCVGKSKV